MFRGDIVKSRLLNKIVGLGLVLSLLAVPVKADSGIAFGISGNIADFTTTGNEEENWGAGGNGDAIEVNSGRSENQVEFGAVFLEFAGRNDWAGMTVGVEYIPGEASLGTKTRSDSNSEGITGDYTAKAEVSDHYHVYIEPTIYATEGIGVYLKGGVNRVTVKTQESLSSGGAYGDVKIWGASVGAGLRYLHESGFLIKTEYARTRYEGITLNSTGGNINRIKADPRSESIRLAIGYQF